MGCGVLFGFEISQQIALLSFLHHSLELSCICTIPLSNRIARVDVVAQICCCWIIVFDDLLFDYLQYILCMEA